MSSQPVSPDLTLWFFIIVMENKSKSCSPGLRAVSLTGRIHTQLHASCCWCLLSHGLVWLNEHNLFKNNFKWILNCITGNVGFFFHSHQYKPILSLQWQPSIVKRCSETIIQHSVFVYPMLFLIPSCAYTSALSQGEIVWNPHWNPPSL